MQLHLSKTLIAPTGLVSHSAHGTTYKGLPAQSLPAIQNTFYTMATWTADAIIEVVFIILYAIILVPNIFNVIKHGIKKEDGYSSLVVVSLRTSPLMRSS